MVIEAAGSRYNRRSAENSAARVREERKTLAGDLRSYVVPERYDQLAPLSSPRPMSRVTFRQTSPFFCGEQHSRRWSRACIAFRAGRATSSDTKLKDGPFVISTAVVADFGLRDWARQEGEESHRFVSPSMAFCPTTSTPPSPDCARVGACDDARHGS